MRRVVITGLGIISCLGNDRESVTTALREARSGIRYMPDYAELGLRSHVAGVPDIEHEVPLDRKWRRFMGDTALYACHALRHAIADAALSKEILHHPRTGLVVGSGVGSPYEFLQALDTMRERGVHKMLPYTVPRVMGSTTSACLSTFFGIRGPSYTITSACASSAHCIGHAADLIRFNKQDVMIAGGAEEVRWTSSVLFDAMGALATTRPDSTASRPYDAERDGFVIAGGGGILILEELEHAQRRGARILAELTGYGASSDGSDMTNPDADGAVRAMRLALDEHAANIDYINTHATSTPAGDISELDAIRTVFGAQVPPLSSTKGLTGHPIAASGAHEAIFGLLMMERGFLAGCAHIDTLDPGALGLPLLTRTVEKSIDSFMTNSFGFGGTNASLVFQRI